MPAVHVLATVPDRNTIPYIRRHLRPHTQRPDAGLGPFNDS